MRCRRLKDWKDELSFLHRDLVWFGSYGKVILVEKHILNLIEDETDTSDIETMKNQTYTLTFKCLTSTTINFYDNQDNIIDSYTTDGAGTYNLKGTLTDVLFKVEINTADYDTDVPIILTLNEYSLAKFYNDDNIHDNFSQKQEAVKDSLTQKLSVIEKELWYQVNYGMPILNKLKSKLSIDAFVSQVITNHPDVISIEKFESKVENKKYICSITVMTDFGELKLTI